MKRLIDIAIGDSEVEEALQDITEFKFGDLNKFTADDFIELASIGFKFTAKSVTQRRSEMRTFISEHPECQSADFNCMVEKITYYVIKKQQIKRKKHNKINEQTRRVIRDTVRAYAARETPEETRHRPTNRVPYGLVWEPGDPEESTTTSSSEESI